MWKIKYLRLSVFAALIFFALFTAFLISFVNHSPSEERSSSYDISRLFKYSFTVYNPSNNLIKESGFWTYSPRKISGLQKLVKVDASLPVTTSIDSNGNEKFNFIIKDIPPFGSKVISISVEILFSAEPGPTDEVDLSKYLRQETNIESENTQIVLLAKKMKMDAEIDTLTNIYKWINENIVDAGFIEQDHGALYTIENKRGDCTEFMNLFLALARANNIPSRGVAGYVYPESTVMRPKDYHNWVEVYLDGVWHVVDPLNNVFFEKESQYVAMRVLGNIVETDNTQRFFGGDESIRVSMN